MKRTTLIWVALLGIFTTILGTILMFIPVNEKIYLYSDRYYDYYGTITTFPYAGLGLMVFFIGTICMIVGYLFKPEDELEKGGERNE